MKRLVLASMLVLCISGLSFGVITIDGSASDWSAGSLNFDPSDHGGPADIVKWGVTVGTDGGVKYLYSYFEDTNMERNVAGIGKVCAATMIDVDRTRGTATTGEGRMLYNGTSALGHDDDNAAPEFLGINQGYDVQPEWGKNAEGLNFWGTGTHGGTAANDSVWDWGDSMTEEGNTATSGAGMEYRIPIETLKNQVRIGVDFNSTATDKVTIKKVWKIGVRLASNYEGDGNAWEGDKSGDATNPSNPAYKTFVYLPIDTIFGDASEDGRVDVSDLGILAANYGQSYDVGTVDTWAKGDFNGDGKIDVSDLGILAANYGTSFGGAVPEPMTMSLLAVGGLALLRRKS